MGREREGRETWNWKIWPDYVAAAAFAVGPIGWKKVGELGRGQWSQGDERIGLKLLRACLHVMHIADGEIILSFPGPQAMLSEHIL